MLISSHSGHPFSRSYGVILPSSLMIVISTPEHFQPVYLCQFAVRSFIKLTRGFSGQRGINRIRLPVRINTPMTFQGYGTTDFPIMPLFMLSLANQCPSRPTLLRHPFAQTPINGTGIFNLFSIAYSNWPRLRYRLTLSG